MKKYAPILILLAAVGIVAYLWHKKNKEAAAKPAAPAAPVTGELGGTARDTASSTTKSATAFVQDSM